MRLIDADAEVKKREKLCEEKKCEYLKYRYQAMCKGCSIYEEIEAFDSAEKVEAEPVRHGRWVAIPSAHDTRIAKCSVCGFWQKSNGNDKTGKFHIHNAVYKYCSGCGAKMDGGADNG